MRLNTLRWSAATLCLSALAIGAQAPQEAHAVKARGTLQPPQPRLTFDDLSGVTPDQLGGMISGTSGSFFVNQIRALGMLVFTTPFTTEDGYGDGPFDPLETDTAEFGHRPTLQGNGTLLRVNGLDAQSCNECHVFVSNATQPPRLGIGGVGGMVNNAIILPTQIDVADAAFDGIAEYNGRFANPPFLFGGGGVELLGKEMTNNLQLILQTARLAPANTLFQLDTHGVNFGTVTSLGGGNVDLKAVGVGPEHTTGIPEEEVLVVRPFGRKGENFTMRDFDRGAMQFHFGIQPTEVVGVGVDEDGDGVVNAISNLDMTLLHIFDVTNPPPFQDPPTAASTAGAALFDSIGCTTCHIPSITTELDALPLATPEVPENPSANIYANIDLRNFGFVDVPVGGVEVPLFADLKRHAMGPRLAETFHGGEIANDEFTTARLWGIADTAPYLHDGRATSLFDAIEFHGGEAQGVRDAFMALTSAQQNQLIAFLKTLRTPEDPNQELVDIVNP